MLGRQQRMSLCKVFCGILLLTALVLTDAAPSKSKESANENESASVSHEADTKETSEESAEAESEYQDKGSVSDAAANNKPRYPNDDSLLPNLAAGLIAHEVDYLRPLPLPETYGIPAYDNQDMIPLAELIAESVLYVQEHQGTSHHSHRDDTLQ